MLETYYHVVCDGCRNYAGYNAHASVLEAFGYAKKLGWNVEMIESKTRGGWEVFGKCPNCQEPR